MIDRPSTIEIALSIRPHLSELLNEGEAEQMQRSLDELLKQFQAGEVDDSEIWELLTDNRATRVWVSQVSLETKEVRRGHNAALPGNPSPISAPQFKCPRCDFAWSRSRVGAIAPICPNHHVPLAPVS